jgi:hypothetical protein
MNGNISHSFLILSSSLSRCQHQDQAEAVLWPIGYIHGLGNVFLLEVSSRIS